MSTDGRCAEALAALAARGVDGPFDLACILGSGLGAAAEAVEGAVAVDYADIPHFPRAGVVGHGGRLIAGTMSGSRVVLLQGRAHYYETGDAAAMRVPVATVAALGAPALVLTNAAGSTRADTDPGTFVLLSDHIAWSGLNPLIGETGDGRFVSMADAYDPGWRRGFAAAAGAVGSDLLEGVYMWFSGPSFETPAEIRAARLLGADLVGMSTVPEVILARFFGLKVAALSLVTNLASGMGASGLSHRQTTAVAGAAAPTLVRLLDAFLSEPSVG